MDSSGSIKLDDKVLLTPKGYRKASKPRSKDVGLKTYQAFLVLAKHNRTIFSLANMIDIDYVNVIKLVKTMRKNKEVLILNYDK